MEVRALCRRQDLSTATHGAVSGDSEPAAARGDAVTLQQGGARQFEDGAPTLSDRECTLMATPTPTYNTDANCCERRASAKLRTVSCLCHRRRRRDEPSRAAQRGLWILARGGHHRGRPRCGECFTPRQDYSNMQHRHNSPARGRQREAGDKRGRPACLL